MKRFLLFILLISFSFLSYSQDQERTLPMSWEYEIRSSVSPIELPPLDIENIVAEDSINDLDKSLPWRYGCLLYTSDAADDYSV